MGAWGEGLLDNDSAQDMVCEHEKDPVRGIRKLLGRKNTQDYEQQEVLGIAAHALETGHEIPAVLIRGLLAIVKEQRKPENLGTWSDEDLRTAALDEFEARINPNAKRKPRKSKKEKFIDSAVASIKNAKNDKRLREIVVALMGINK